MMLSSVIFLWAAQPTAATETVDSPPMAGHILPPHLLPINQAVCRYPARAQLCVCHHGPQRAQGKANGWQVQPDLSSPDFPRRGSCLRQSSATYEALPDRWHADLCQTVSLEGLAAGQYRLKLVAYEETTKKTAVQSQDFTIH